ncbi:prealbumin-like fold domain-containing protein [Clostridiaceae bacterium 35-E11]
MKCKVKLVVGIFLIMLLAFGGMITSIAASVTPSIIDGNDPKISGYKSFKIDDVETKPQHYSDGDGDLEVTVTFAVYHEETNNEWHYVDWSSNISVGYVFVKGGHGGGGYLYEYDPPTQGDAGLTALINAKNGKPQGISHVTFYYCDEVTEPEYGSITVNKSFSDERQPSGITFKLYKQGEEESLNQQETNDQGIAFFENLLPGSYTLEEIVPDGYITDLDSAEIIQLVEGQKATIAVLNTYVPEDNGDDNNDDGDTGDGDGDDSDDGDTGDGDGDDSDDGDTGDGDGDDNNDGDTSDGDGDDNNDGDTGDGDGDDNDDGDTGDGDGDDNDDGDTGDDDGDDNDNDNNSHNDDENTVIIEPQNAIPSLPATQETSIVEEPVEPVFDMPSIPENKVVQYPIQPMADLPHTGGFATSELFFGGMGSLIMMAGVVLKRRNK